MFAGNETQLRADNISCAAKWHIKIESAFRILDLHLKIWIALLTRSLSNKKNIFKQTPIGSI